MAIDTAPLDPPAMFVEVEESVLQEIHATLKKHGEVLVKLLESQATVVEKLQELTETNDALGFKYRVLAAAVDHARSVALRVETRLKDTEYTYKMRARSETLQGVGEDPTTKVDP